MIRKPINFIDITHYKHGLNPMKSPCSMESGKINILKILKTKTTFFPALSRTTKKEATSQVRPTACARPSLQILM